MGLAAAAILVWDKIGLTQGFGSKGWVSCCPGLCAAVVHLFGGSRLLAEVPSESVAVSCLATAALAFPCSLAFEEWVVPPDRISWLSLLGLGLGPVCRSRSPQSLPRRLHLQWRAIAATSARKGSTLS